MARNGGTGFIEHYYNGVAIPTTQIYYSTSTASSLMEDGSPVGVLTSSEATLGNRIMLGSGLNWPINVDYVQVWQ
jgi:hypothetical protein